MYPLSNIWLLVWTPSNHVGGFNETCVILPYGDAEPTWVSDLINLAFTGMSKCPVMLQKLFHILAMNPCISGELLEYKK